MREKRMTEQQKGQMARNLVIFCIAVLTASAVWAMVLKTASVVTGNAVDLSDVLVFTGAAFGGELLMLLAKRIFAKPTRKQEEE